MPASQAQPGADDELTRFLAARPGFDLARFDSYDDDAVAGLKLPRRRSEAILAKLRGRQRMLAVTDDPAVAEALTRSGLDSAHLIAAMPAHRFAREHAGAFGGDEFAARQVHQRARSVTAAVSHLHANLAGVLGSPHFAALHGNHADPGLAGYFAKLHGYQDLFGSLDFCACQHCGSIFSPAAYFADLMRIIDDYITDVNGAIPVGYHLRERRPDLFELPLTCANTNDVVPSLQLVNSILARRIAAARQVTSGTALDGGPTSITLAGSASPDDGAYDGLVITITSGTGSGQAATITRYTGARYVADVSQRWATKPDQASGYVIAADPYRTLASAPYPFNLPWNAPLARTRASLGALRITLPEIDQAFAAPVTGGAARGGEATTIKLAPSASAADDAYDAMTIALIGGTGAGQERVITGYHGAARQAIVARPWQEVPDDTTQYHVLDTTGADREQLGLSVEQYAIVTTPRPSRPAIAPYYGVAADDLAKLSRTEVFCAHTGLRLEQLAELLTQGLSKAEQADGVIADTFFINATGELLPAMRLGTDATDPNAPVSVIENLTVARLDRLNRFIRLATITGWGYAELDWALRSVTPGPATKGNATQIDKVAIRALAGISRLATRTGLTITELTAFWWPLATIGRGNGPAPADPFDRVFNPPALLAGQDPYASVTPIPFDPAPGRSLDWNPAATTGQDSVIRGRLSAALTVGDDDLTRLAEYVHALGGVAGPSLKLDLDTLSWLYRLAAMARAFRLTVEEYLTLLRLMYHPGQAMPAPGSQVPTVDAAAAQAERADWLARSGWTVYSLRYVLEDGRTPHLRPPYALDDVAPFLTSMATSAQESRLTPDSFAYGTVTQDRSEQVFADLVTAQVLTDIGVVRDAAPRYEQAARSFPLTEESFTTGQISPDQSRAAFAELRATEPPVLLPIPVVITQATLSRSFTGQTDLSFLFTGDPDAANKRNQVRTVLLRTRQRISVTEFAFLFPLAAGSFTSKAITPAESESAFGLLATHPSACLLAGDAAGQQRKITSYDGASRTATVTPAWDVVPAAESSYVITKEETSGAATGGALFSVKLAPGASRDSGAYAGMTIAIASGPAAGERAVITSYDGDAQEATTATAWVQVPGPGDRYVVTSQVAAGLARRADATHLTLDAGASPAMRAYDQMTVTIARTGELSARFDAGTDLGFLFQSQGGGQTRDITGYDGPTRTATVATPWQVPPDDTTYYLVTRTTGGVAQVLAEGIARGGDAGHLYLAPDASGQSDAYAGCTLTLAADPAADRKRGEVRQVLLTVAAQIEHAASVVAAADVLQQDYATQGLADFLGTTAEWLAVLIPAATGAPDLAGHLADLLTPVLDGQVPADVPPLVGALSRALVLTGTLGMSPAQALAVTRVPQAFGIADPKALTFDGIVWLTAFMSLEGQFADSDGKLSEYFRWPGDASSPGPKADALAALTGWAAGEICQLARRFWPAGLGSSDYGPGTVAGIARLAACFDLVARTGLEISALLQLAALAHLPVAGGEQAGANWQAYQDAARLGLDAVRARYGEPEFGQADAQVTATISEQARDALLGYAIWLLGAADPEITDASSLYEYLLIDVEVAGCAQTSPIASGIAALQLYLQRCRLMLETGVRDLSEIDDAWWEWMSAYRVWEANRKIFLYPENYRAPSLRRGASPEFTGLAQALLETDVSDKSVAAAYQRYFDAFAITGNLVACDAYQCKVPQEGTSVPWAQGTVVKATPAELTLPPEASDLYNAYLGRRLEITSGKGKGQARLITAYSTSRVATVDQPWATEPDDTSRFVITGPRMLDTLFLIGRTNTDPPVFYHRRHDQQRGWTPWREIEVTIPVRAVVPVYAFGRLHVFWAQQHTTGASTISTPATPANAGPRSVATTSTKATVKCAYLDTDGTWSAEQTVIDDVVIDYEIDYALDSYVPGSIDSTILFSPVWVFWRKALPLHVPAAKVTEPGRYPNGEQILLTYGMSESFEGGHPVTRPGDPNHAAPPDQRAFEEDVQQLWSDLNTMGTGAVKGASGLLQFVPGRVVSSALTRSLVSTALVNPPETAPSPYVPFLWWDETMPEGKLFVANMFGKNLIASTYWADSPMIARPDQSAGQLTSGAQDDPTAADLLTNVSMRTASVATVKNMPGSFIFSNGDETLLARSSDDGIRTISEVLTATIDKQSYPRGYYYVETAPFTSTSPAPPLASLKFAFTRLSTRAARALSELLRGGGIPDLLSLDAQRTPELPFARLGPTSRAIAPATDMIDFDGAYGLYFWEIFFHAPFLVAEMLAAGRRFREAKAWLEYVYNPTQQPGPGDEGQQRYWRFLPLRTMDLPTLTQTLASPAQIAAYNDQPFDPDAIARLRVSAYAKAVVLRYVDNLLNWGDDLFAQDTRESVDEATNLYVLALNLLGPRPRALADCEPPAPASYDDIKRAYANRMITRGTARVTGAQTLKLAEDASKVTDAYTGMYLKITSGDGAGEIDYITRYDGPGQTAYLEAPWSAKPPPAAGSGYEVFVNGIPQFLIRLENSAPVLAAAQAGVGYSGVPFNDIGSYFCVPENDQLIAYWDRAEDRLFKIRHCMNIDGVVRALPLFAPPINPAALVAAAAAGGASPAVASQLNLPVPFYRFTTLIARAKELAGAVAGLGGELLAALEKKDAEALALLQVSQQQALLSLSTSIKELAVEQTTQSGQALAAALASAEARQRHYSDLVAAGLSPAELENIVAMQRAATFNLVATALRAASAIGFAIPQFGSPFAMTYGGQQVGSVLAATAGLFDIKAVIESSDAQLALMMSQYERRGSDWGLQKQLAEHDVAQVEAQIAINSTQATMAERDLALHLAVIAQNDAVGAFLTAKFTSAELYQWMSTRLSALHFQTYALALDLARSAQRAFQYELNTDATFVNFGYWDGARRGLLAGEGLLLALNQMEKAHTERNVRALAIEKTISLGSLDPLALRALIEAGECTFALPEKLFDDDYPGHYARKISALSVSIPAITGPYQNLHATLTQLANQMVVKPDVNAVNFLLGGDNATLPGPDVLRTDWWVNQQIAISRGLGDNGVFDTDPMDGRLLPFEGTGAVSTWRLSLPRQTNHFDFNAISDVIITLRYQAFDGGARLRDQVTRLPAMSSYTGSIRLPLAQVFSSQWHEFLHATADPDRQVLRFTLADLVPPHIAAPVLTAFSLHLQVPDGISAMGGKPYLRLRLGTGLDATFGPNAQADYTQVVTTRPLIEAITGPGSLEFTLAGAPGDLLTPPPPPRYLDPAVLQNATLVLIYQGKIDWRPRGR